MSYTGHARLTPDDSSTFVLGEKNNLKAEAVVYEIKRYLRAFCHPFVSMAVKEMEYGRGLHVHRVTGICYVLPPGYTEQGIVLSFIMKMKASICLQ